MKRVPLSNSHIKTLEDLSMIHDQILSLMLTNGKRYQKIWNEIKQEYPNYNFKDARIDNINKEIVLPHQKDEIDVRRR